LVGTFRDLATHFTRHARTRTPLSPHAACRTSLPVTRGTPLITRGSPLARRCRFVRVCCVCDRSTLVDLGDTRTLKHAHCGSFPLSFYICTRTPHVRISHQRIAFYLGYYLTHLTLVASPHLTYVFTCTRRFYRPTHRSHTAHATALHLPLRDSRTSSRRTRTDGFAPRKFLRRGDGLSLRPRRYRDRTWFGSAWFILPTAVAFSFAFIVPHLTYIVRLVCA